MYRDPEEEHFGRLAEIVKAILGGGLDTVEGSDTDTFYAIGTQGIGQIFYDELPNMLNINIDAACVSFGDYDVRKCLMPHLKAEYPELSNKDFDGLFESSPHSVIQTLEALARRKTFKGTCHICKGWQ